MFGTILQYRAARLYFDTSMEEEDITEWMHLESPSRERVVTPFPLNKSTEDEENKLCLKLSTHKKVLESLSPNKYIEDKENNMTVIRKLHMKIISLKSENSRLRKQVRKLKFRLHHTVRIRKTAKKNKQKKKILRTLIDEQDLHAVAKAMIHLQLHTPNAAYTEEEKIWQGNCTIIQPLLSAA